jgi:peptidoglycan/xylan/chitin deacetylase (PgdA/CDA1 family)
MRRRELAAAVLERSGLGSALRAGPCWRGLLVLCHHRVTAPEILDEQLRLLTRHFEVVPPRYLLDQPELRRRRLVVLTFDDGYRDNHALALPVLRARGVAAGFFVATGFIDRPRRPWWDEIAGMVTASPRAELPAGLWLKRPLSLDGDEAREVAIAELVALYKRLPGPETEPFLDFLSDATDSGRSDGGAPEEDWMTWDMVRDLRDAGMDIGGHTIDHPVLGRLDEAEQRWQIEGCRRRLEAELGLPMRLFSYPVGLRGSFDARTRACLADAGVELAFSLYGGYVRPGAWDPYDVRRSTAEAGAAPFRAMAALPQVFARW